MFFPLGSLRAAGRTGRREHTPRAPELWEFVRVVRGRSASFAEPHPANAANENESATRPRSTPLTKGEKQGTQDARPTTMALRPPLPSPAEVLSWLPRVSVPGCSEPLSSWDWLWE